MDPLTFRCTGCGNCCRALRVAVTAADVMRLAQATGSEPPELIEWLAPDQVDMSGEPQSFVELGAGRRLMVLAQRDGACTLLDAEDRCRAYAARPRDCRAFPFDFSNHSASSGVVRLGLLPLSSPEGGLAPGRLECDYARDGQQDAAALAREDAERWLELSAYQRDVARWNRLALHRRRLRHRVGDGEDFLRYVTAR